MDLVKVGLEDKKISLSYIAYKEDEDVEVETKVISPSGNKISSVDVTDVKVYNNILNYLKENSSSKKVKSWKAEYTYSNEKNTIEGFTVVKSEDMIKKVSENVLKEMCKYILSEIEYEFGETEYILDIDFESEYATVNFKLKDDKVIGIEDLAIIETIFYDGLSLYGLGDSYMLMTNSNKTLTEREFNFVNLKSMRKEKENIRELLNYSLAKTDKMLYENLNLICLTLDDIYPFGIEMEDIVAFVDNIIEILYSGEVNKYKVYKDDNRHIKLRGREGVIYEPFIINAGDLIINIVKEKGTDKILGIKSNYAKNVNGAIKLIEDKNYDYLKYI